MPTIDVLIFRGTGGVRNKVHPFYNEPGLVRAGHVGVSGVIDGKIIGFHPTPEAVEQIDGEERLIMALANYEAQEGRLQDDELYFKRAYELVEATQGRTTVFTYAVEISEEQLLEIQSWYDESRISPYNFPDREGQFRGNDSNCATFWMRFGIPLPLVTGSLQELTDFMRQENFEEWRPNEF